MNNPNEYVKKLKDDYDTLSSVYLKEKEVTALLRRDVKELTDALSDICTEFNQLEEIIHPNSENGGRSFPEIRKKVSEYVTANTQLRSANAELERELELLRTSANGLQERNTGLIEQIQSLERENISYKNDISTLKTDKESANTGSNERKELLRSLLGLPIGTNYEQIKAAAENWSKKNEVIATKDEEKTGSLEDRAAIIEDKPPILEEPDNSTELKQEMPPIPLAPNAEKARIGAGLNESYATPTEIAQFSINGVLKGTKNEPPMIPTAESAGAAIGDTTTVVIPDKEIESDDSKVPVVDTTLLEKNIFTGVNVRCTSPELSELPEVGVHDMSALISPRKNRRVLYARVAMSIGCLSLLAYHYVKEYNHRSIISVGNGESAISSILKTESEPQEDIATTNSKGIMYSNPPQITEFTCQGEYDNENPNKNQCQITASSSAGEEIACEINCNGNTYNLTVLMKWNNTSSAFNIPAGCAPEGSTAITLEAVCYERSNIENKSSRETIELKIKQEEPLREGPKDAEAPPQNQPPTVKLNGGGNIAKDRINSAVVSLDITDDSEEEVTCFFNCKAGGGSKDYSNNFTIGTHKNLSLKDICSSPKRWYRSGNIKMNVYCTDSGGQDSEKAYATIQVTEKENDSEGVSDKYNVGESVPPAPTSSEEEKKDPAKEQQTKTINACGNLIVKPEFKRTMPPEWLSYRCDYKNISSDESDKRKCIRPSYYKGDDSLYTNDKNTKVIGCLCCPPEKNEE